jgi:uncharacterized protein YcbX
LPSLHLTGLTIYPVKSARGIPLSAARLDERGLEYDRRWMVVDEAGEFLTQRKLPRMALVHVELQADVLRIFADGMKDLHVPLEERPSASLRVHIWDDSLEAFNAGKEAESWFTEMLGRPCKLVRMPHRAVRVVNPKYSARKSLVSFADAFPLLLISQASLEGLNARLATPVPMNRFRPNLVVGGASPYEEDSWKSLRIGSVAFRVAKPCSRCTVPTVDQETGERDQEPIRTLKSYRTQGSKVYFGQNLVHEGQGILTIGDPIEPLAF